MPLFLLNNRQFETSGNWEGCPIGVIHIHLKIAVMYNKFPAILENAIDRGYMYIRGERIMFVEVERDGHGWNTISRADPIIFGFSRMPVSLERDVKNRLLKQLSRGFS